MRKTDILTILLSFYFTIQLTCQKVKISLLERDTTLNQIKKLEHPKGGYLFNDILRLYSLDFQIYARNPDIVYFSIYKCFSGFVSQYLFQWNRNSLFSFANFLPLEPNARKILFLKIDSIIIDKSAIIDPEIENGRYCLFSYEYKYYYFRKSKKDIIKLKEELSKYGASFSYEPELKKCFIIEVR